jgi:16S rRNA (guanine527-N7)-methyltransferase
MDPDLDMSLLEAKKKKVYFLRNLIRELGLEGIKVYWTGEKPEESLTNAFDIVVSRAFGSLLKLAIAASPYLKAGGTLLAMKGKKGKEELMGNLHALEGCNFEFAFSDRIHLPVLGHERVIISLKKAPI